MHSCGYAFIAHASWQALCRKLPLLMTMMRTTTKQFRPSFPHRKQRCFRRKSHRIHRIRRKNARLRARRRCSTCLATSRTRSRAAARRRLCWCATRAACGVTKVGRLNLNGLRSIGMGFRWIWMVFWRIWMFCGLFEWFCGYFEWFFRRILNELMLLKKNQFDKIEQIGLFKAVNRKYKEAKALYESHKSPKPVSNKNNNNF